MGNKPTMFNNRNSASQVFFALVAASCSVPAMSEPTVVGYELVSSARTSRTVSDYVYRVRIGNSEGHWTDVTFQAASTAPGTTLILDSQVALSPLTQPGTFTSKDTFSIRHDRMVPFDPSVIVWRFLGRAFTPADAAAGNLLVSATDGEMGAPADGAQVFVDGRPFGTTSTDGTVEVRVPPGKHTVQVISSPVGASADVAIVEGETASLSMQLKSESALHERAALFIEAAPEATLSARTTSLILTILRDSDGSSVRLTDNVLITVHYTDEDTPSLVTDSFVADPNGSLTLIGSAGVAALLDPLRTPRLLNVFGVDDRGRMYEVSVSFSQ